MTTDQVRLPHGWQTWPPEAKERLLTTLRAAKEDRTRSPFYCDRPDCDGEPHGAWRTAHARGAQHPPPGGWDKWVILAGRGFGKTRTGAEWAWRKAKREPRGALIAPTAADARDTMVEGESGILACAPALFRPKYEPSKRRLTYPNGAIQTTFSADEPDRLRGPQHNYAWGDEWAAWRHLDAATDMLEMGLRLGDHPQALFTTTPRPRKRLREVIVEDQVVVTRGSTYDNLANLAPSFQRIIRRYEGTSLGRQELLAEVLTDVQGALWTGDTLAASRRNVSVAETVEDLARVVVAVDPAATSGEDADETGIVVVGVTRPGHCPTCGPIADGPHGWVLEDLSGRYTPNGWAARAVSAYDRHGGDAIIAEVNNGGEMVGTTVATLSRSANYRAVRASRGKRTRAEPVAALYEQGRIHHAPGLDQLEEQQRTWVPGETERSPDRMDAAVWGLTDLMLTESGGWASVG